jgi:hypothetical protein
VHPHHTLYLFPSPFSLSLITSSHSLIHSLTHNSIITRQEQTRMSSFTDSTNDKKDKTKKPKKEKKERESAKDRKARKEAEKNNNNNANSDGNIDDKMQDLSLIQGGGEKLTEEQLRVATFRSVTGVLASTPEARDVKFDSFSLMVGGNQLVTDCHIEVSE